MVMVPTMFATTLLPNVTANSAPGAEPSVSTVAAQVADAFDAHFALATTVVAVPLIPVSVDYSTLLSKIEESLNAENPTAEETVAKWGEGLVAYWTPAKFGATSTPPTIPPTSGYETQIANLWKTNAESDPPLPAATILNSMSTFLHAWVVTILVGDTVIPPPTGTPPAPII